MGAVFVETVTIILKSQLYDVLVAIHWYDIPLETEKIRECCKGYDHFDICNVDEKKMKTRLLIIVAVFLVMIPWIRRLEFGMNNQVMADGITISTIIVMTLTIMFSLMSWVLFSWASKSIKFSGILLSIITGTSLVIPFLQVLGPMAGIIVGIVAGFVAFMLQKKMLNPAKNQPLIIATIILATTYSILFTVFLMTQSSTIWDTEVGIGAWTGTTEGLERPFHASILLRHTEIIFIPIVIMSMIMTGLIIRDKGK